MLDSSSYGEGGGHLRYRQMHMVKKIESGHHIEMILTQCRGKVL